MLTAGIVMTALGAVCFLARGFRGPTLGDRAIAIDGFVLSLVAVMIATSLIDGNGTYLVVGLIVTLMGFLATSAVARFIELRGDRDQLDR